MENTYLPIFASAVRAATISSSNIVNYGAIGVHLVIDITSVPGVDTITPKIEGYDAASDKYYDILVGVPVDETGVTVLKVYPGAVASPNVRANDALPTYWRVTMTHSAATNFTYSVGASLLG